MLKIVRNFFYYVGLPFYLVLETLVLFSLALSWYIGRFFVTQTPPIPRLFIPKVRKRQKIITMGFLGLALLIFTFWYNILRDLPAPEDLVERPRPLTTHILDRNENLLFKIYRNENRTKLTLEEIPTHAQQATIAIEDAEFYNHPGFSLRGMARAFGRNLAKGELVGGSTITQQLVKNALLSSEKTFRRKIKELILSVMTEVKFSKKEILAMYLNQVNYGGAAYGIEEAANTYFGKSARDLTLAESALLAGLPAAPTRFSPFGANPEMAKVRQKLVLSRMVEEGFITPAQAEEADNQELSLALTKGQIKAPHFVMYVKQILAEKYGEYLVENGGLTVVTSLDLSLQEKTEDIVSREVASLARLRVGNGGALVTNPATGEILAMVGSRDYFDTGRSGNFNVTTAQRQPGSAIKPVNYSYALANGYTPASLIDDSPVTYSVAGSPPYTPRNYDGQYRGRVTLRTALGSSLNVPAVKVLASYGVAQMLSQGKKLGITTWEDPSRFGLSLTLGGGEVKMTDMAVVFGTFANYGQKVPLNPIVKVTNSSGKVLESNTCNPPVASYQSLITKVLAAVAETNSCGEQALDPRIAFLITDILHDNNARIPVFGPGSLLVVPNHPEVAVKTGTTQNLRDNWTIGYTKDYLVATWVGNNDNTPMSHIASGVTGASPIWHKIMREILEGKPNHEWEVPIGVVSLPACGHNEWFLSENQTSIQCPAPPPEATPSAQPNESRPPTPNPEPNEKEREQGQGRGRDNRDQNQE